MHPNVYRRKTRTGWCAGLILAALLLRLLIPSEDAVPGLLETAGERLKALADPGTLYRALLWLETGGALRAAEESPAASADAAAADPAASADLSGHTSADPVPASDPAAQAFPSGGGRPEGPDAADPIPDSPSASAAPDADSVPPASAAPDADPAPPASAADPAPSEPPFTAEEAEAIRLRGNCSYTPDVAELLLRPLNWTDEPGPKILVIHTHSCEAYTPVPGHTYTPDGDYRTLEPSESVIAVGDALTEALGELGVEVIHDRTCCDYPSYNSSYAVARTRIRACLEEYPSIRMVIDLHRDAMDPPVRETAEIDGQEAAALMLVIGTDEGGLSHPDWADNLSCGLKLQALANRSFPGLFKAISFRRERFNGDLTPGSLIVEVGSTGNTLEEARAAMPALAEVLADLLAVSFR